MTPFVVLRLEIWSLGKMFKHFCDPLTRKILKPIYGSNRSIEQLKSRHFYEKNYFLLQFWKGQELSVLNFFVKYKYGLQLCYICKGISPMSTDYIWIKNSTECLSYFHSCYCLTLAQKKYIGVYVAYFISKERFLRPKILRFVGQTVWLSLGCRMNPSCLLFISPDFFATAKFTFSIWGDRQTFRRRKFIFHIPSLASAYEL